MKKSLALLSALLIASLALGTAAASACGGGHGAGGVSTSKLVTTAATGLGVSRTTLVGAIQSSGNAAVDAAVAAGTITAARGADEKQEIADNLNEAYRWSTTGGVATNLGITTSALDAAFLAARKSILNAQIDASLAAGKITADQAAAQKTAVAALTTGYKPAATGSKPASAKPGRAGAFGFGFHRGRR